MHARPAGPTLLQRPGRQTYGKGSVLHGTGPSFPSAALSSPTRILLVHERGDHAPQPLHGGIPMSALVPDELRNPFLRTLLGKRQNPEFIRARDFTRKRLGTGQAEVGTPHHLHGAEEVRRSHRTRPCDPGKLFKNPCSQAELNKIVPFGFSLQRQKMVFFCHQNSIILLC